MRTVWNNLCLLLVIAGSAGGARGQDLFSYDHSITYAWHLVNQGKHAEADTELERISLQAGASDTLSFLRLYNAAQSDRTKFFTLAAGLPATVPAHTGNLLISTAFMWDSIAYAEQFARKHLANDARRDIILFHAALYRYDTASARVLLHRVTEDSFCPSLKNLYERSLVLPRKKYPPAILLSTLIPGAGRIYAGQTADGVIGFLSTGLFTFQAVSGFTQKGVTSVYGWIYAGLASAFYAGNIYGSWKAVQRFNAMQLYQLRNELKSSLHCHIQ